MIAVSNTIINDCNSESLNYKEYIIIDDTTVEIKGKMSNSCYNEGNIFGTFIFKKLEFTTENDINYKKKEFEYYKSINGNAFKIGTYIVTDVTDNDSSETVKVTSYDYGLKFAIPYVSTLDYESGEVTLYDVLDEACTNAGVSLSNATITNGNFIIDSNQFVNGELIGDVIKAVAQMSGDFATINEDDELELIYEEETNEIIEDYEDLDDKRDTKPITSVSIGSSTVSGQEATLRDEAMIALYGEHWLILNDNPFAYTLEKRQELVTDIFNKVKGFSYSSFESKYAFKPYLQLGDKIQFKNKNGDLVDSRIFKIDTDYDDIRLSAPSIIDASVDYTKSPSAEEIAKRAEIIANQASASITAVVEETTENSSKIVKLQIDSDKILTSVTNTQSDVKTINTSIQTMDSKINQIKVSGGSNLLRNTDLVETSGADYLYWTGSLSRQTNINAKNGIDILLQDDTASQEITLANGNYIIGFNYERLIALSIASVSVNGATTTLGESGTYELSFTVSTNSLEVIFTCDTDNGYAINDLMSNAGSVLLPYSNNQNEIRSEYVTIGRGIEIRSDTKNTINKLDADGMRVLNASTNEEVQTSTDEGGEFKKIVARENSTIAGLSINKVGTHVQINGVL